MVDLNSNTLRNVMKADTFPLGILVLLNVKLDRCNLT